MHINIFHRKNGKSKVETDREAKVTPGRSTIYDIRIEKIMQDSMSWNVLVKGKSIGTGIAIKDYYEKKSAEQKARDAAEAFIARHETDNEQRDFDVITYQIVVNHYGE